MKFSYSKSFVSAVLLTLSLEYVSAAEPDTAKNAQREAALSRIELFREAASSNIDEAERESFYGEYGGNLEAYVLNGLSRSEEETLRFYKEAYDAFVEATNNSFKDYAYSSKISDLAVKLNNADLLRNFFEPYLENETLEQNMYIAKIDFAYGLERFGYTSEAEELLLDAMSMRSPVDAYEATYRYLELLKNSNRSEEALKLLENLPKEYRERFTPELLYLKKDLMIDLGTDIAGIDSEIEQFLEKMSEMSGVGITQRTVADNSFLEKFFGIQRVNAFSHLIDNDDSRGTLANSWWYVNPNLSYARWAMNGAEVLYNEARGESSTGQIAVAWAIRNRAFIDMNGADHYAGSESDNNVNLCRIPTPMGPQPQYPITGKHYSCVVHGDTWVVGGSHSQMNDGHVDLSLLMVTGLMSQFLGVVNNYTYDPTYFFIPFIQETGNPNGAQEWLDHNYCAANDADKRRHGNIGGDDFDNGNICGIMQHDWSSQGDNYFWGRKN